MSRWTHAMCADCWEASRPGDVPCRVLGSPPVACCFCQAPTADGIYVREDPTMLHCRGVHPDAEE